MQHARLRLAGLIGIVGLLAAVSTPAYAGVQHFKQHDRNVSEVKNPAHFPCLGKVVGERTLLYDDVFHGTITDRTAHFGGTVHGTVEFVPSDPTVPTYTGGFALHISQNVTLNHKIKIKAFTVHATGSDGSRVTYHQTMHAMVNADGTVGVSFDKRRCG